MLMDQNHPDDSAKKTPTRIPGCKVKIFGALKRTCISISSSPLGNENGVALVTALILGLVGMLMIATLMNIVGTGVWTSGSKKRYQTALEGSRGGLDFFAKEIIQRGISGTSLDTMGTYTGILTPLITAASFTTKLTTTGRVGDGVFPATNPDAQVTFLLAPNPNITVNTTILSASRGNSGTSSNILGGGGVVTNQAGTVVPQHIPYLYQIETRAQATSSQENAILSASYAY